MNKKFRWKRLIPFAVIFVVVFALAKWDQHTGSRFHDWAEGWQEDPPWWFQAISLVGIGWWIALGLFVTMRWLRRRRG